MGDYTVSRDLFPEGMVAAVKDIRAAGFLPGIWFEPEAVGSGSRAYTQTDHLLKRDNHVITTATRRFWDMRDPWVREYLHKRVIAFLQECGFCYVKLDYNDTIGLGCDGAESLGEGLRQNMEATRAFWQELRAALPDLIIESCASGGHRLEPQTVMETDMSSFSDAHECVAIPIIAANLLRTIPARKSQVWAVIRKDDTPRRIAYSISSALLGRLCLSGDVTDLSPVQWKILKDGLQFYQKTSHLLCKGSVLRFGPEILSYDQPQGWQAILRTWDTGESLLVFHQFGGPVSPCISVALPRETGNQIIEIYAGDTVSIALENHTVVWHPTEAYSSVALWLKPSC